MTKFLSDRQRTLSVGISNYTEGTTVLDVTGSANISGIVTALGGFNLGISSSGTTITSGPIKTLNFVGSGNTFSIDGTTANITISGSSAASVAISTTPPTSPNEGDLWYSSILGRTFVYFSDGSSSQWVDSAPFNVSILAGLASEGYVDNLVAISTFSGDYNDLTNTPTIPSIVGLASEGYVDNLVAISTFSGVGIQSAGSVVGYGITTLNFIGAGNTFSINGSTLDISISGSGGGSGGGESYWESTNVGINTTSNVGIGTTNPLEKLHVLGNLLVAPGVDTSKHITLKTYETNNGTLSWESAEGQLFSITNNLTTGSIFSVNDVSGIPSIDVDANGDIDIATFNGTVSIGAKRTFVINSNTTLVKGRKYVYTSSITMTLPPSPSLGDSVSIVNRSGTTTATVQRNGSNIMGLSENITIDKLNAALEFVYANGSNGWIIC